MVKSKIVARELRERTRRRGRGVGRDPWAKLEKRRRDDSSAGDGKSDLTSIARSTISLLSVER